LVILLCALFLYVKIQLLFKYPNIVQLILIFIFVPMLQKIAKDRLDKVLEVIENSGMRFPVTEIADRLKNDKGMVSAYIKGKKPISSNFYSNFMKEFDKPEEPNPQIDTKNIEIHKNFDEIVHSNAILVEAQRLSAEAILKHEDTSKMLAETNRMLVNHLLGANSNVAPRSSSNLVQKAQAKLLQDLAEAGAGDLWETADEGLIKLGRFAVERHLASEKSGR
jgi:hypothetical protein